MKTHTLKTWPSFLNAVISGDKTFEVRRNDRDFAVGDVPVLKAWGPSARPGLISTTGCWVNAEGEPTYDGGLTAQTCRVVVTYVLPGGRFGIDPDWCVLGIRREEAKA